MAGIKGKPVAVAATERRRLVVLGNVPADWSPLPGVPASRAECIDGPRPCRWIRCRLHLWRSDPWDQPGRRWPGGPRHGKVKAPTSATCALDVTDANPDGLSASEVGVILGVSPERVRQIEERAAAKMRAGGVER